MDFSIAKQSKLIAMLTLGGMLEFFDFTLYALFSSYIAAAFFPVSSHFLALLESMIIFSLGYLARPIGGILFGHIGDKFGRKRGFVMSALMMATATLAMALLPGYSSIGFFAPILLLGLRLIQGLSVGGEIPGATSFAWETFQYHRWFAVSMIFAGVTLGNVLASSFVNIVTHLLSHTAMVTWGWRIPFVFGFILGLVAYVIRKNTVETAVFKQLQAQHQLVSLPLIDALKYHKRYLFTAMNLVALSASTIFVILYLQQFVHSTMRVNNISLGFVLLALSTATSGYIADKISARCLLIAGCVSCLLLSLGFYHFFLKSQQLSLQLFYWIFPIAAGLSNGVFGATIVQLFKPAVRYSCMGLAYNLGFALFGGLAPLLMTFLSHHFASISGVFLLLAIASCMTLMAGL